MKVGDLVRYRQRKRSNVYGFITEKVDDYKVRVSVFNNKDPWFQSTICWDKSHWEVISESG
tara:strand:+ start:163 stop:345 length:183 start_codon:yes stop_codon:yes gene_type:complete